MLSLVMAFADCKKGGATATTDSPTLTVSGTLQVQGITYYQYGTHTIKNIDQFFALKSSTINLSGYSNKSVTITAVKVAGYPVEGSPELLDVQTIKLY